MDILSHDSFQFLNYFLQLMLTTFFFYKPDINLYFISSWRSPNIATYIIAAILLAPYIHSTQPIWQFRGVILALYALFRVYTSECQSLYVYFYYIISSSSPPEG